MPGTSASSFFLAAASSFLSPSSNLSGSFTCTPATSVSESGLELKRGAAVELAGLHRGFERVEPIAGGRLDASRELPRRRSHVLIDRLVELRRASCCIIASNWAMSSSISFGSAFMANVTVAAASGW